jgi:hypothetical protein
MLMPLFGRLFNFPINNSMFLSGNMAPEFGAFYPRARIVWVSAHAGTR